MSKIADQWKESRSFLESGWGQVLVVLFLVGSSIVAHNVFRVWFEDQADNALIPLEEAYEMNLGLLQDQTSLDDTTTVLLKTKVEILEKKKAHNKYIFTKTFSNYYAVVTVVPILSGLLVIVTFLIAQKGWGNTTGLMRALFFTLAMLSAWYGLFPTIYQQQKTVDRNLQTYIELSKLQKNIFDYSLTQPVLHGDTIPLMQFLDKLNQREKDLQGIVVGLEMKSLDESFLGGVNDAN